LDGAAALATEIRVLAGKLKRKQREQADAGDLPPSQIVAIRAVREASGSFLKERTKELFPVA
jgi:hypothetical protein